MVEELMKETLYEGKYIRIVLDGTWEYVERVGNMEAAIIIPVFVDKSYPIGDPKRNNLILIREFRVPLQKYNYGLPAGLVGDHESNEDPLVAAHRELEEETGYKTERMRYLMSGPPSSGLSNEILHFYLADKLTKVTDEVGVGGEDITVHVVPINEAQEWLMNKVDDNNVVDPKVFLGLYFAQKYQVE